MKRITTFKNHEAADLEGVTRFTHRMIAKLEKKRREGRGGWNYPDECSMKFLRQLLKEHMAKGDMIDIANIAMFIWNRQNPCGVKHGARKLK